MAFAASTFPPLAILPFNALSIVDADTRVTPFTSSINWAKMLVFDLKTESLGLSGVPESYFLLTFAFFVLTLFYQLS